MSDSPLVVAFVAGVVLINKEPACLVHAASPESIVFCKFQLPVNYDLAGNERRWEGLAGSLF